MIVISLFAVCYLLELLLMFVDLKQETKSGIDNEIYDKYALRILIVPLRILVH